MARKPLLTKDQEDFVRASYKGISSRSLADKVNAVFGTSFTAEQMQQWKHARGMASGYRTAHNCLFTAEQESFVMRHYQGISTTELAGLIKQEFGMEFTGRQLRTWLSNHHLANGYDASFKKGHVPCNKGKKCPGQVNSGCFAKGHRPHNHLPIGTTTITTDGYRKTKIAEPNKWRMTHYLVWETANGPVPKGKIVIFADGNPLNCALENLLLVSRNELVRMNQMHLPRTGREITKSSILMAKLKIAATAAKQRAKKERRKK